MPGLTSMAIVRRRILARGIIQGVGFRPFVYGLAQRWGLTGFVMNDSAGVTMEVEGTYHAQSRQRRQGNAQSDRRYLCASVCQSGVGANG